jgi:hypothetical protein
VPIPAHTAELSDLISWPGDTASTSYRTGGVVIELKEYFYAAPADEDRRAVDQGTCTRRLLMGDPR